jgi:hypothetical protein
MEGRFPLAVRAVKVSVLVLEAVVVVRKVSVRAPYSQDTACYRPWEVKDRRARPVTDL